MINPVVALCRPKRDNGYKQGAELLDTFIALMICLPGLLVAGQNTRSICVSP